MTMLFCDGFDSYTATADLLTGKKWASNTGWTWNATAGRNGGGGLLLTATTGTIQAASGSIGGSNPVCMGLWFKTTAAPSSLNYLVKFYTSSGTYLGGLGISTGGFVCAQSVTGAINNTGITNVCDGNWHWIEFEYDGNGSASCPYYVDGTLQFTATGLNNNVTDYFQLQVGPPTMTVSVSWPMLWNNATGAPVLSSLPIGPKTITTIRPVSDGTCTFGTVSAGTNHYAMVDEIINDGDATYVEGVSGSGLQDLYNYASISGSPAILTVMLNTMLDNPSGGTANFQTACKSSATTSLGTSTVAGSSYAKMNLLSVPTDPNTGAAWTASGLSAAQFGVKAV